MIFWPATVLNVFDSLPLRERLFVRARAFSAPLEAIVHRVVGQRVVDVGCGHGVLVAMLAVESTRHITGIDPDVRKIEWAKASVGRLPNVTLRASTIQTLEAEAFDTMCVADVLYLLPSTDWRSFLRSAHAALKPGGRLLLKEVEDDGSWRARKALLQERLMVGVLRRTSSSGAVQVAPRAAMSQALRDVGFEISESVALAAGFTTPHVLFVATKALAKS